MFDKLQKIVRSLGLKQHSFEYREDEHDQPLYIRNADVQVGDWVHAADTAISIDRGLQRGSDQVNYTTPISPGMAGENKNAFNRVVDVLNYEYPGKFVRDYTDGSQDVLYTTGERATSVTPEVLNEHLDHHAQVVAEVVPELEHVTFQLRLEPKVSVDEAESFAQSWSRTFISTRKLTSRRKITYLPRRE